jgi:hypothetical protein
MAYRIPNKNPIDVGSRVAIGVSIPFNAPQVFTQTYTTQDQVKSNIINFILTNKGERVFNPTFGSNIRKYVFEQVTPSSIKNLQTQLLEVIQERDYLLQALKLEQENHAQTRKGLTTALGDAIDSLARSRADRKDAEVL